MVSGTMLQSGRLSENPRDCETLYFRLMILSQLFIVVFIK